MDAILTSTAIVALAEIGDKTQLLAILLATRFRKPLPIILGILFATLANHFLAALVGSEISNLLSAHWFRYVIGLSFIAMAAWTLIPDKLDDDEGAPKTGRGAFMTTLVSFFIVEMGDKTQIATIALGAQYQNVLAVMTGTTIGMMLANVPAVFLGKVIIDKAPLPVIRMVAAALFFVIGLWVLAETAGLIG